MSNSAIEPLRQRFRESATSIPLLQIGGVENNRLAISYYDVRHALGAAGYRLPPSHPDTRENFNRTVDAMKQALSLDSSPLKLFAATLDDERVLVISSEDVKRSLLRDCKVSNDHYINPTSLKVVHVSAPTMAAPTDRVQPTKSDAALDFNRQITEHRENLLSEYAAKAHFGKNVDSYTRTQTVARHGEIADFALASGDPSLWQGIISWQNIENLCKPYLAQDNIKSWVERRFDHESGERIPHREARRGHAQREKERAEQRGIAERF